MRDSLSGNASQILWEGSDDAHDQEIIRLLKMRFGNTNQMERFRAELRGRRRRKGIMDFSLPRLFAPWNIRTLELSLPGTFQANGGWSESTQSGAKVDDMLSHFHMIPDRYGQTERQTDRFAISIG